MKERTRELLSSTDKLIKKIDKVHWDIATEKYKEAFAKIDFGVGKQTSANGGITNMARRAVIEDATVSHIDFDWLTERFIELGERLGNIEWPAIEFVRPEGLRPDTIIFDDPDLNIAGQLEI